MDASLRLTGDLHAFVTGSSEIVHHSTPNFDEFIICKVNADITILSDDSTPIEIESGTIKVMPYKHARDEILKVDSSGDFVNDDRISLL